MPISSRYRDMLDLPRPVSGRHARMDMIDRAAQFSPFAALTGYDAVIKESARLTEQDTVLAADGQAMLDEKLRWLAEHISERPLAVFTWFRDDLYKAGGSYIREEGRVLKIDLHRECITLTDRREVPIYRLQEIEIPD